jgi:hypothetical protein
MPIRLREARGTADILADMHGGKEIYCHQRRKLKSENSPLRRVLFRPADAH